MLKKLTLSAIIASSLLTTANAFEGFYLGGQVSLVRRQDTLESPAASISDGRTLVNISALRKNKKNYYRTYGLVAGHGKRFFGTWYAGGEINVNTHNYVTDEIFHYEKCQLGKPAAPPLAASSLMVDAKASMKANYQRGMVSSLVGRVGKVFNDDILIYGRLGLEHSKDTLTFKYRVEYPGHLIEKENKSFRNSFIWVPGIGIEKALGKFLLRGEYNYSPGLTIKKHSLEGEPKITQTMQYKFHMVKVGLLYNF